MADEAFGMSGVGQLEDASPLDLDERCTTEVDVGRRVEPDARMAVVAVVPAEEASAEGAAIFNRAETIRELWSVLERLELSFRIRIDAPIDVKQLG